MRRLQHGALHDDGVRFFLRDARHAGRRAYPGGIALERMAGGIFVSGNVFAAGGGLDLDFPAVRQLRVEVVYGKAHNHAFDRSA